MLQERPLTVFKPQLPDSVRGVDIVFEVSEIRFNPGGKTIHLCCLSANIVNKNSEPIVLTISYSFQKEKRSREISVGPYQQKIIILDKQEVQTSSRSEMKQLYGSIELFTPLKTESSFSALTSTNTSR